MNIDRVRINLTPEDQRPFNAAGLWDRCTELAPDQLENLFDFEASQWRFDDSEGVDVEAREEAEKLALKILQGITRATS